MLVGKRNVLITDVEPGRPSSVVTKPVEEPGGREDGPRRPTREEIARARGTDPKGLRHQLRGDLDNIVLKAMSKVPSRRYVSASQLSEDLRRYLEDRRAGLERHHFTAIDLRPRDAR